MSCDTEEADVEGLGSIHGDEMAEGDVPEATPPPPRAQAAPAPSQNTTATESTSGDEDDGLDKDLMPMWFDCLDKSHTARQQRIVEINEMRDSSSILDDEDAGLLKELQQNEEWYGKLKKRLGHPEADRNITAFRLEDENAIKKLKRDDVHPPGRDVLLKPLTHVAEKKTDDGNLLLSCRPSDSLLHQLGESSNDGSFVRILSGYMFEGTSYRFPINRKRGDGCGAFLATRLIELMLASAWASATNSVNSIRKRAVVEAKVTAAQAAKAAKEAAAGSSESVAAVEAAEEAVEKAAAEAAEGAAESTPMEIVGGVGGTGAAEKDVVEKAATEVATETPKAAAAVAVVPGQTAPATTSVADLTFVELAAVASTYDGFTFEFHSEVFELIVANSEDTDPIAMTSARVTARKEKLVELLARHNVTSVDTETLTYMRANTAFLDLANVASPKRMSSVRLKCPAMRNVDAKCDVCDATMPAQDGTILGITYPRAYISKSDGQCTVERYDRVEKRRFMYKVRGDNALLDKTELEVEFAATKPGAAKDQSETILSHRLRVVPIGSGRHELRVLHLVRKVGKDGKTTTKWTACAQTAYADEHGKPVENAGCIPATQTPKASFAKVVLPSHFEEYFVTKAVSAWYERKSAKLKAYVANNPDIGQIDDSGSVLQMDVGEKESSTDRDKLRNLLDGQKPEDAEDAEDSVFGDAVKYESEKTSIDLNLRGPIAAERAKLISMPAELAILSTKPTRTPLDTTKLLVAADMLCTQVGTHVTKYANGAFVYTADPETKQWRQTIGAHSDETYTLCTKGITALVRDANQLACAPDRVIAALDKQIALYQRQFNVRVEKLFETEAEREAIKESKKKTPTPPDPPDPNESPSETKFNMDRVHNLRAILGTSLISTWWADARNAETVVTRHILPRQRSHEGFIDMNPGDQIPFSDGKLIDLRGADPVTRTTRLCDRVEYTLPIPYPPTVDAPGVCDADAFPHDLETASDESIDRFVKRHRGPGGDGGLFLKFVKIMRRMFRGKGVVNQLMSTLSRVISGTGTHESRCFVMLGPSVYSRDSNGEEYISSFGFGAAKTTFLEVLAKAVGSGFSRAASDSLCFYYEEKVDEHAAGLLSMYGGRMLICDEANGKKTSKTACTRDIGNLFRKLLGGSTYIIKARAPNDRVAKEFPARYSCWFVSVNTIPLALLEEARRLGLVQSGLAMLPSDQHAGYKATGLAGVEVGRRKDVAAAERMDGGKDNVRDVNGVEDYLSKDDMDDIATTLRLFCIVYAKHGQYHGIAPCNVELFAKVKADLVAHADDAPLTHAQTVQADRRDLDELREAWLDYAEPCPTKKLSDRKEDAHKCECKGGWCSVDARGFFKLHSKKPKVSLAPSLMARNSLHVFNMKGVVAKLTEATKIEMEFSEQPRAKLAMHNPPRVSNPIFGWRLRGKTDASTEGVVAAGDDPNSFGSDTQPDDANPSQKRKRPVGDGEGSRKASRP